MNNFLPLDRSLLKHWIWESKPFSKGQAWVDLLMLANYNDKKKPVNGEIQIYKRGDVNLSMKQLSDRWGWDRRTVKRFLDLLSDDGMVSVNSTTHGTTITIVNYDVFNSSCTTECITSAQQDVQQNEQQYVQQMLTTNKDKELKEIKEREESKKDNKNNLCKAEAEALFENLWKLYPVKKGKGQVSLTAKQRLLKVGHDEMVRAIDRYKTELEKDSDWRKPQNGSTFFNSGYVDYLDKNYEGGEDHECSGGNAAKDISDPYADEFERLLNG